MENQGERRVVGAHGLSAADLIELQHNQNFGSVNMIDAVNDIKITGEPRNKGIEEIAKDYQVPECEYESIYHVIMSTPKFNEGTGEREDRGEIVQKFSKEAMKLAIDKHKRASRIVILHDPSRTKPLKKADNNAPVAPNKGKELAAAKEKKRLENENAELKEKLNNLTKEK